MFYSECYGLLLTIEILIYFSKFRARGQSPFATPIGTYNTYVTLGGPFFPNFVPPHPDMPGRVVRWQPLRITHRQENEEQFQKNKLRLF